MLTIYPFSIVDQELALKNAQWIAELGEYKSHDIFILSDHRCDPEINKVVVETFTPVFRIVKHRLTKAAIDGWPEGANHMFGLATTLIQNEKEWPYFLWLEPDAIPLREGWLDAIVEEFVRSGKVFMGDRVQVENIPLHMSGVGIYPNPIYMHAGEACRAHDEAWDMAARNQIIPKVHWTTLIEHAWKHPTFKDQSEINTQIAKETVLFHSSKDGSLIDLLRQKAAPVPKYNSVPTEPTSGLPSREEIGTRAAQPYLGGDAIATSTGLPAINAAPTVQTAGAAPVYDIFIRTYPGDYQWLQYCLESVRRYVTGFRKVWIISPSPCPTPLSDNIEWKVLNEETEDGYLAQQIHKLYADVITEYQADYYLMLDSDTLFTRPTTPGDFFKDEKLIWYYTPYDSIKTPWKPVIEKFMGFEQPYEFMRRLPMMIPRSLLGKLREFCYTMHKQIISDYIRAQPLREFSEFNVMGAYAYFHLKDQFHWVDTTLADMPPPLARQFFSWGGITDEVKKEIDTILPDEEKQPPEKSLDAPTLIASTPVAPPISGREEVKLYIDRLARFADESPGNKAIVTSLLFYAGLRQKVNRKKTKKWK